MINTSMAWSVGIEELKRQADSGSLAAMGELGRVHLYGLNVPVNYEKAFHWLGKAVEGNDPAAQTRLGYMYDEGLGVEQDFEKAFHWYSKAAEQGYALGQRPLGVMYELGKGVARDPSKAAYWYRQASEKGVPRAQVNLGILYETGLGVEKDFAKAVYWYEKSTEKEYPRGQTHLGRMYERGLGVGQDVGRAAALYRKAMEKGYKKAEQYLRDLMKREGKSVQKDTPPPDRESLQADKIKEAEKGGPIVPSPPLVFSSPPPENRRENERRENAAEAEVYYNLGLKYLRGESVIQDAERASYWFEKAYEKGNKGIDGYVARNRVLDQDHDYSGSLLNTLSSGEETLLGNRDMAKQFFTQGNDYARQQRYDLAVAAFEKALSLDPGNNNTRENLAIILVKTGNAGRAVELMREVVSRSPRDASRYINYGIMLHLTGMHDEALGAYRQALRLDPTMGSVYHDMAIIFAQKGEYASAWRAAMMARGLGVDDSELLNRIDEEVSDPIEDCTIRQDDHFHLRQIVTRSRREADEVVAELLHGKSFSELATVNSLPQYREKGGYMGIFSRNELDPKIKPAISEVAPFCYSPVVETEEGFHIFQVIPTCKELHGE